MPSFNLGPHPKMMQILDADPDVKKAVSLMDFIHALDEHNKGYSWKDLAPDTVPLITWYNLYDAYLQDELNNRVDRDQKLREIENAQRNSEIDTTVRNRVTGTGGQIHF